MDVRHLVRATRCAERTQEHVGRRNERNRRWTLSCRVCCRLSGITTLFTNPTEPPWSSEPKNQVAELPAGDGDIHAPVRVYDAGRVHRHSVAEAVKRREIDIYSLVAHAASSDTQ